jgi:hypothetical protein
MLKITFCLGLLFFGMACYFVFSVALLVVSIIDDALGLIEVGLNFDFLKK